MNPAGLRLGQHTMDVLSKGNQCTSHKAPEWKMYKMSMYYVCSVVCVCVCVRERERERERETERERKESSVHGAALMSARRLGCTHPHAASCLRLSITILLAICTSTPEHYRVAPTHTHSFPSICLTGTSVTAVACYHTTVQT
jgi:hypothetical protein